MCVRSSTSVPDGDDDDDNDGAVEVVLSGDAQLMPLLMMCNLTSCLSFLLIMVTLGKVGLTAVVVVVVVVADGEADAVERRSTS